MRDAQRGLLLPLIENESAPSSMNAPRSVATRLHVVRHSPLLIWVAASQSDKQVLSQKAMRSFMSFMSSADLPVDAFSRSTGWARAVAFARQKANRHIMPRMSDPF